MFEMVKRLVREEEGQGMAEYGLILALIAVVCILVFTNLGTGIRDKIQKVVDELD